VFSDGSTMQDCCFDCRDAMHHLTVISRHLAFVHPSTFYHRATTILQWLSSRVLGVIEVFFLLFDKEFKGTGAKQSINHASFDFSTKHVQIKHKLNICFTGNITMYLNYKTKRNKTLTW